MDHWEYEIRSLFPGWDGEDAPIPSDATIQSAKEVIEALERNNLFADSIDADVVGGVGIYLSNSVGKTAWISIQNSGFKTIVLTYKDEIISYALGPQSFHDMKIFLQNEQSTIQDIVNMKHNFKDDSNCSKCNCYGPYEESLPCIEVATVQGTINEAGHWEPMISIPVSEYEELREKAFMYDELCK